MDHIKGLLFDKDGTLFDYDGMWGGWVHAVIETLAPCDLAMQEKLAASAGFDLEVSQFEVGSAFVNGTADDTVDAFLKAAPHLTADQIIEVGKAKLETVEIPQVCDLEPLLKAFRAKGLALGVATNDFEAGAVDQLTRAGVLDLFDFVVGYDSGHGSKPEPGMIHGFCKTVDLEPSAVAMIGDSTHDLHAARAAGAYGIGVLTGPAAASDLEGLADLILPDISEILTKLA